MVSTKSILIHSIISLVLLGLGVYVLVEQQIIISGKLTGSLYKLGATGSALVAVSFLFQSVFSLLVLVEKPRYKKISVWLLIVSLILFVVGVYTN
ncbi:MAG: hypothetical protein OQK98_11565 [Gammaproteobacteria bacterium]|nr:hypothetical protein [Gammaproteobacteria bacterium]